MFYKLNRSNRAYQCNLVWDENVLVVRHIITSRSSSNRFDKSDLYTTKQISNGAVFYDEESNTYFKMLSEFRISVDSWIYQNSKVLGFGVDNSGFIHFYNLSKENETNMFERNLFRYLGVDPFVTIFPRAGQNMNEVDKLVWYPSNIICPQLNEGTEVDVISGSTCWCSNKYEFNNLDVSTKVIRCDHNDSGTLTIRDFDNGLVRFVQLINGTASIDFDSSNYEVCEGNRLVIKVSDSIPVTIGSDNIRRVGYQAVIDPVSFEEEFED